MSATTPHIYEGRTGRWVDLTSLEAANLERRNLIYRPSPVVNDDYFEVSLDRSWPEAYSALMELREHAA